MLICIASQGTSAYPVQADMHDHWGMNYLQANLKYLIGRSELTENALALETGVGQSQINRIVKGTIKEPRDQTVRKLADRFQVSVHELKYVDLAADTGAGLGLTGSAGALTADVVRIQAVSDIPSAGVARLNPLATGDAFQVLREWLTSMTDAAPSDVKFAHQPDDSMQGEIEKGDVVFIDTSVRTVATDGIYAFTYFGMPHIKRGLVVGKDSLRFTGTRSFNSIPVEGVELDGLEIIGKVFATIGTKRF